MPVRSFLSLDIGSHHTRTWLYDNSPGSFRLVACGETESTITDGENVLTGVWKACDQVQRKTNYRLTDHNGRLIIGQQHPENEIEGVSLSVSGGSRIRTAIIGLTAEGSLAAIRKLASQFYIQEIVAINLHSDMDATRQLEILMEADVDLIILTGGNNQGARKPLLSAAESIHLVYAHLPRVHKPQIVFAGNASLQSEVSQILNAGLDLHVAPNIQPDFGIEDISSAWGAMLSAYERIRLQQINGLKELKESLGCRLIPTAFAVGRSIRYLDQISRVGKGVLALDVGAGSSSLTASKSDHFTSMLAHSAIGHDVGERTAQWLSFPLDDESVSTYMHNKSLHPAFMAATLEDLAIEHAWTRVRLQDTCQQASSMFENFNFDEDKGLIENFEPVILCGESLTNIPTVGQQFLIVLDGLQPHGITTLVLDHDQVLASLGALAEIEPLIPVQVLEGNVFKNLGTVICIDSPAREGQVIMTIEIARDESEQRETHELRKGTVKRFNVRPGTKARFYLAPSIETNVGMGHVGLGGWVTVAGSEIGVVIDARGRPIMLPSTIEARSEKIRDWLWELEG